jgi:phosphonate transport system substrate-binding protein
LVLVLLCCWLGFSACGESDAVKQGALLQNKIFPETKESLSVAIAGMVSPQGTYTYYKDIVSYLSNRLGLSPLFVLGNTYAEVNDLILNREIDLAFVCSGAYVKGQTNFGLEALAAPQVNGQTVYYSYIIVNKDSPVVNFAQLHGKTFAFTDPNSNTGYFAPLNILAQMNETVDSFFRGTIFVQNHDRSIITVANKLVDGAAVDSLIWEFMQITQPDYTSQTKIIQKVGPYGMPPVVVHPELDQKFKERLQSLLLGMHNDLEGKAILEQLNIDRFVLVEDAAYDSIRKMLLVQKASL